MWKTYIAEIVAFGYIGMDSFLVNRPKVRGGKKVFQCLVNDSMRPYKPRCRHESTDPTRLVAKPVESILIVFIKVIESLSMLNTKPAKLHQGIKHLLCLVCKASVQL